MKRICQTVWRLLKSPHTSTILLYTLLFTLLTPVLSCPVKCDCQPTKNGTQVSCRDKSLNQIPDGIPMDTYEIDLSYNNLVDSTFSDEHTEVNNIKYTNVVKLSLDFNFIEAIYTGFFKAFPNVESISLDSNMIDDIHQDAFQGLHKLKHLYIQSNLITVLKPSVFQNLQLVELNLERNKLINLHPSVFDNCGVQTLRLDYNNIPALTQDIFKPLKTTLQHLYVSYNKQPLHVDESTFQGVNLEALNLCYNGITNCSFLSSVSAHRLDLSGNAIHISTLGNYPNLQSVNELILVNSSIQALDIGYFKHLTELKLLDLTNNKLTAVSGEVFLKNSKLEKLLLNRNTLSKFPTSLGEFCPMIKKLMLASNQIKTVTGGDFDSISLQELDLSYNNIQIFEETVKSVFDSIQVLALTGNPLYCNCEMSWFREWLDQRITFTGVDGCVSPRRISITDWTAADFLCKPPRLLYMTPDVNVSEGKNVLLSCTAEGDPAPEIIFSDPIDEGISISPQLNRTKTKTYAMWQVNSIPVHKAGLYTCKATNRAGSVEGSICISVRSDRTDEGMTKCVRTTTPTTSTSTTTTSTTTKQFHTVSQTSAVSTSTAFPTTPQTKQDVVSSYIDPTENTSKSIEDKDNRSRVIVILCIVIGVLVVIVVLVCVVKCIRRRRAHGRYSLSHQSADILEYHKMNGQPPTDKNCNGHVLL